MFLSPACILFFYGVGSQNDCLLAKRAEQNKHLEQTQDVFPSIKAAEVSMSNTFR